MKVALERLIAGELPYILVGRDNFSYKSILLPGSFNPLHKGHTGLLCAAETATHREGVFELSVMNVDKPPLDIIEVERRLLQLKGIASVVLTCAPTFSEKAELFPGSWFVLGYDTAIRLLSPEYHADVPAMLARFLTLETRFVVGGRLHEGQFQGLADMDIPAGYEALFIPLSEQLFREDISSTKLRS